jgi:serine/threonine-protein kinase HipA
MTEKKITVFIYLPGEVVAVPVGIFTHNGDLNVGRFAYGRKYIDRPKAISVDPVALPIGIPPREVTTNRGLYGAFRDAAPDYWGRVVIAAERRVPPEAISETDFLLEANATRVGNLDFRLSLEDPEPRLEPPHFNQMEEILEAGAQIEEGAGGKVRPHLLRLLRQGSSLGGARPKCTVVWQDALWVAKFPAKNDTMNIPRIEYATMELAKKCGIRLPELQLKSVGGKDILLVRRFDREKGQDGWTRKGFLSSLSLMQWDEFDRLSWDYVAIADNMRRYVAVGDIQELFRRMVYNIMVRNTDDHPRNHGFLVDGEKIELSPAYDIVPAFTQAGVGTDFDLAMSVGKSGRDASLENALSRVARFGLSNKEANSIVAQIAERVRHWRDHFEDVGLTANELHALKPSFARCAAYFSKGRKL